MRKAKLLFLMMILCGGLAFTAGEQRKPVAPTQANPQMQGRNQMAVAEKNKEVVRQVFDDLFSRGRYELIGQIYTKDCAVHFANQNNRLAEAVAEGKGWRSASPDLVMTAQQITVNGDIVTVNWIARGTNTGKGNGVPATGKRYQVRGVSRFRLVDGKIAEVWNNYDRNDLFRQLGVNPKLGQLYDLTQEFALVMNRIFSSQ
jgi:steroid delta-isomerase-like uncharacterized protein